MFFAKRHEHAAPFYNILGLLTFNNIFKLNSAIFAHKIVNNNPHIPTVFKTILKMVNEQHSYYTRFSTRGNIV